MLSTFSNRRDAGRVLAAHLTVYSGRQDVSVLALPRGGVPVAYEVALALHAPLDVLIVRKLGVPAQPELAMGAIASGNTCFIDERIVNHASVSKDALNVVIEHERAELARRERLYRGTGAPLDVNGRVAIVIDDGMATGATMKAAALSLRRLNPARIVAALPLAPIHAESQIKGLVDEFVCAIRPLNFFGVGQFYMDFEQTSDDEVLSLLTAAR